MLSLFKINLGLVYKDWVSLWLFQTSVSFHFILIVSPLLPLCSAPPICNWFLTHLVQASFPLHITLFPASLKLSSSPLMVSFDLF